MIWILFTIVMVLLYAAAVLVAHLGKKRAKSEDADTAKQGRADRIGGNFCAGALAAVWLIFTLWASVGSIPAGHAGLIYQFGAIRGQTSSGFVFVDPWQNLRDANTQTQAFKFNLDGFSKETQNVYITATLNYRVAPKDVQTLYRTVGPSYFETLVPQRINQAFKDETVKFRAVEIAPHRTQIRDDVLAQLKTDLAPFSIQATALNIDNISFSKAFTLAIEDKQIATQQAQAAQNRVAVARYQAQQIIATAKGQAQANTLKRETLTPLLVEQNAIDKLNPHVQVIMVPSGSNFLLPNLLNGIGTSAPATAATPAAPTKKK